MRLISCRNVSFAYEGIPAVQGINFDLEEGDYLYVVGENGTGKSTLIKGLLKLKKPYEGEIILADNLKSNEIGYLPQQTIVQKDFPATVMEVVLSGCLNQLAWIPFYRQKDKDLAKLNLHRLGIENLKKASYRDLSGGQQQRVLLARALCATQKIIILDEPVAGLDPIVTAELYELIHKINQDMGITIVMVSHDINAALNYANKILHLRNEQLFFGNINEYKNSPIGQQFMKGYIHV